MTLERARANYKRMRRIIQAKPNTECPRPEKMTMRPTFSRRYNTESMSQLTLFKQLTLIMCSRKTTTSVGIIDEM